MSIYQLEYNGYFENIYNGLCTMLASADRGDVTLAVEGKYFKAHQTVLSLFSPYFKELFSANPCSHPIFFMQNVKYNILRNLLTFIYEGKVQISENEFYDFMSTAKVLQVKGLENAVYAVPLHQNQSSSNTQNNVSDSIKKTPCDDENLINENMIIQSKDTLSTITEITNLQLPQELGINTEVNTTMKSAEDLNVDMNDDQCHNTSVDDNIEENSEVNNVNEDSFENCVVASHEREFSRKQEFVYKGPIKIVTLMKKENSSMLIVDGHLYYRHKSPNQRWIRWRCARCPNGTKGRTCRAHIHTSFDNFIRFSNIHDHDAVEPPSDARILCREVYKVFNKNRKSNKRIICKN